MGACEILRKCLQLNCSKDEVSSLFEYAYFFAHSELLSDFMTTCKQFISEFWIIQLNFLLLMTLRCWLFNTQKKPGLLTSRQKIFIPTHCVHKIGKIWNKVRRYSKQADTNFSSLLYPNAMFAASCWCTYNLEQTGPS